MTPAIRALRIGAGSLAAWLLISPGLRARQGTPDSRGLQALQAAAETGDARAQLDYAKALRGTPESRVWATKAADQGLGEAWFWLGYTTSGGSAVPFYEKAAEGGYAEAFSYLFDDLLLRAGEAADVVRAKKFADLARRLNITSVDAETLVTVDRCAEAGPLAILPAAQPTPAEAAAFATGECDLIRAGVGQPADAAKFGRCVLAQNPVDRHDVAEVYANGYGVQRNAMTAIAFLCHSSDVPAELEGMVDALYTTRGRARLAEPFRFCAHVTSGMNQGVCALRDEAIDDARRDAAVATMTGGWPAAHTAGLRTLLSAADAFFEARSETELDMTGTARVAIAVEEARRLRQEMLDDLRAFEAGRLPPRLGLRSADTALNAAYGQLMRKQDLDLGTVTTDDVRETQRAWLTYRDAWGRFGALRYPELTSDQWKAWVTTRRTTQLSELLAGG